MSDEFKYEYPIKTLKQSIAANKRLYKNKIITHGAMALVNNQHQLAIDKLRLDNKDKDLEEHLESQIR